MAAEWIGRGTPTRSQRGARQEPDSHDLQEPRPVRGFLVPPGPETPQD